MSAKFHKAKELLLAHHRLVLPQLAHGSYRALVITNDHVAVPEVVAPMVAAVEDSVRFSFNSIHVALVLLLAGHRPTKDSSFSAPKFKWWEFAIQSETRE